MMSSTKCSGGVQFHPESEPGDTRETEQNDVGSGHWFHVHDFPQQVQLGEQTDGLQVHGEGDENLHRPPGGPRMEDET